jgi:hypothetical protein
MGTDGIGNPTTVCGIERPRVVVLGRTTGTEPSLTVGLIASRFGCFVISDRSGEMTGDLSSSDSEEFETCCVSGGPTSGLEATWSASGCRSRGRDSASTLVSRFSRRGFSVDAPMLPDDGFRCSG